MYLISTDNADTRITNSGRLKYLDGPGTFVYRYDMMVKTIIVLYEYLNFLLTYGVSVNESVSCQAEIVVICELGHHQSFDFVKVFLVVSYCS